MTTAALILAAGRGLRAGGGIAKQWREIAGRRVVDLACEALAPHVDKVLVVVPEGCGDRLAGIETVTGGETRAASVRRGLDAVADSSRVLIHDAARPFVPAPVIRAVIAALDTHVAAAPGLPVVDTLWTGRARVDGEVPREGLWRAQTPQGFHTAAIREAHRTFAGEATDDVAVARAAGLEVAIVPGSPDSFKITTAADFLRADRMIRGGMDVRTGTGYDVHRFGPGDQVMLCGVRVPHGRGLQGHSDADVGLHALSDAIYGALAEGDIGQHFPPSDPQWKGTESHVFLAHAAGLARSRGYALGNADVTLVCEYPKIGPHVPAMRAEIARIMEVGMDRIGVKATTSERLGFTGREEGIASLASVTLVRT